MTEPLSAFIPQQENANGHTERGMWMLEESMHEVGWFGAVTFAANNEAFDGSARVEKVNTIFADADPIVVDIDGTRPVYLRRVDIPTADHPTARQASIWANRVSEVNLSWQHDLINEWKADGSIDPSRMWSSDEMTEWDAPTANDLESPDHGNPDGPKEIDCTCPECGHRFIRQV